MSTYELIDLYMSSGQSIDSLWEFFVSIHIAIFGALFIFHEMKSHQIVISVILYLIFSIVNLRAKLYEYEFYESIIQEIRVKTPDTLKQMGHFFNQYIIDDRYTVTCIIHLLSFICLLYLLIKAKKTNGVL